MPKAMPGTEAEEVLSKRLWVNLYDSNTYLCQKSGLGFIVNWIILLQVNKKLFTLILKKAILYRQRWIENLM